MKVVQMQYFVYWMLFKRIFSLLFKGAIGLLIVRVGLYWMQYNQLPPIALLLNEASSLWIWIESTGAVQWIVTLAKKLLNGQ